MSKALDNFINNRKKFSRFPIERVAVKQIGGGFANQCVKNSFDNLDLSIGVKIISGWIIMNSINDDCDIIPHFWNSDDNGNHFDTTPLSNDILKYIIDTEIGIFGQENLEKLRTLNCHSFAQRGNKYIVFEMIGGKGTEHKIADLSNSNIFQFK
jgi:hypothetical protein